MMPSTATNKPRLLFASANSINTSNGAGSYCTDILEYLTGHFEIHLALYGNALRQRNPSPKDFLQRSLKIHYYRGISLGSQPLNCHYVPYRLRLALEKIFPSLPKDPVGYAYAATLAERKWLQRLIIRLKPRGVLVNYCWASALLEDAHFSCPYPSGVLAHDIWHERDASFSRAGLPKDIPINMEEETRNLSKARAIFAISDENAAKFRTILPAHTVLTAVKSVPLLSSPSPGVAGRFLFVGSAATHNIHGLTWFLEKVWPLIRASLPHATLDVAGGICAKMQSLPPSVRLLGFVENLASTYADAEAVLVPLLAGSGVKIKLLEAISHGRPVVSTTVGLQGLGTTFGNLLVAADTPEAFATQAVSLSRDIRQRINLATDLQTVCSALSPSACCQPLLDFFLPPENHPIGYIS